MSGTVEIGCDVDVDGSEMDVEVEVQKLSSGRAVEEIEIILHNAKLDKTDLQPISQEILFSTDFMSKEYRLLQLDKNMLENIQTGQMLVFRGDENDSAVLCTETETFEIKDAETSNSLLLFEDLQMPNVKSPAGSTSSSTSKSPGSSANTSLNISNMDDSVILEEDSLAMKSRVIIDVARSYLEMKRMRPNLSKIRHILRGTEYDGTQKNLSKLNMPHDNFVTLDTLLDKVPASKEEILKHLDEIRVLDIDGMLCLVEDDYAFTIFSQVLNCVDENCWNPNEIDKSVIIETLTSLASPYFIEKIFQWFFQVVDQDGAGSSKLKYTYNENKVCKFLGETLLKSMGKFNLKEFKKVWQESVPEGLKVNLEQLSDIAVYDEECMPPVIWYFPEHNLPERFTDRLSLLFETKKRWKLGEISPFIEVFSAPSQNVGNLLTKYARCSTVNGIKYYTSKHGK